MYKYRYIPSIIVLLTAILVINSCAQTETGGFLRTLDTPARMTIEGERYGIAFSAILEFGEKDESGKRDGEMTFKSPESLAGIRISTAGGVWSSELDGHAIGGISAELLGAPLGAFTDQGKAISAERVKDEEGRALTLIVVEGNEGRFEFFIDSKSGEPVSVAERTSDGKLIMSYDITGYQRINDQK